MNEERKRREIQRLRSFHHVLRNRMTMEEREFHSVPVRRQLRAMISPGRSQDPMLCFAPVQNEPSLGILYEEWLNRGQRLYFPVTEKESGKLSFYGVESLSELEPGAFQIPEPGIRTKERRLPEDCPAICLTPGLVFDRRGDRIGYGGGYYDRFFASHPLIFRIGVGFDMQFSESWQAESWDMPLDALVVESRRYFFTALP